MKQIRFKEDSNEGEVLIMDVKNLDIAQIRVNRKSRAIVLVCNSFDAEKLETMPYVEVKALVEENGGIYENKKQGITFLTNL